jgi:hypothetical protein
MMKTFLKSTGQEVFPMGERSFAKLTTRDGKGKLLKGFSAETTKRFNSQEYAMVAIPTGNTKPGSKRANVCAVRKENLVTRHGY